MVQLKMTFPGPEEHSRGAARVKAALRAPLSRSGALTRASSLGILLNIRGMSLACKNATRKLSFVEIKFDPPACHGAAVYCAVPA